MNFDSSRIRQLLGYQGRTGSWLAEVTGYSRTHVSRMLNESEPVSPEFADRAARALGVPVDWLRTTADTPEAA